MSGTFWTDEEVTVLQKLWMKNVGIKEISQVLNRSLDSINYKVDTLGLRGTRPTQNQINYDLLKILIGEEADEI